MRNRLGGRLSVPVWAVAVTAAVVLFGGLGSAVAVGNLSGAADRNEQKATRERTRAERAEEEAERAGTRATDAEATARKELAAEVAADNAAQEQQLSERRKALDAAAAELEQRTNAVREREAAGGTAEEAAQAGEFGDGVHEVGTDIQPGKYKTEGGSDCYWAKLKADDDIIDNDLPGGPTTVTITASTAKFQSKECGTWRKVA